jgi:hypothetical protein
VIPGLASPAADLAGGAGQRIALGLALHVGEPGLPGSLHKGGMHHRDLLRCRLGHMPDVTNRLDFR